MIFIFLLVGLIGIIMLFGKSYDYAIAFGIFEVIISLLWIGTHIEDKKQRTNEH